jgi:hypothetical protein
MIKKENMTKKDKVIESQILNHVKSLDKFCGKNNIYFKKEYDEYVNLCATHLDAGTSRRF